VLPQSSGTAPNQEVIQLARCWTVIGGRSARARWAGTRNAVNMLPRVFAAGATRAYFQSMPGNEASPLLAIDFTFDPSLLATNNLTPDRPPPAGPPTPGAPAPPGAPGAPGVMQTNRMRLPSDDQQAPFIGAS